MPGVERFSISELLAEATEVASAGVGAILLFGVPSVKDTPAAAPTTTRASSRWRFGR